MQAPSTRPDEPVRRYLSSFAVIFGLAGFALAQPVYDLILGTPEFLVARQNTPADLWWLVATLSFLAPVALTLPGMLPGRLGSWLGKSWFVLVAFALSSLFFAQLLQDALGQALYLFAATVAALGAACSWLLLFTRWRILGTVLAALALSFPVLFLLGIPELGDGEELVIPGSYLGQPVAELPPVVMILADELSLATLLDNNGEIDEKLFPNIHELQQNATWYRNTTTVADGTLEAVSAILTGRYPNISAVPATIASLPVNLFTLLGKHYEFNVTESLSRLCPRSRCPLESVPDRQRFSALLLDLTALFLHRVAPDDYRHRLPNVADNWSGFFAEKQEFFPGGWVAFAEGQAKTDRPGNFRRFVSAIERSARPRLNFIHILYPHVPYVYLPDGQNYGNHWLRGLEKERWGDSPWGVLNGKQRHFLQVQHFDQLLGELIRHLRSSGLFDDSLLVLLADHGATFRVNDLRRALSDRNTADILRVPLLIKAPGQKNPQVVDEAVMTVDILPTMLGMLGFEQAAIEFDGLDLTRETLAPGRERPVLSYKKREFSLFTEEELGIEEIVRENRSQLALDEPERALWQIGPQSDFHGLPLDSLCSEQSAGIRYAMSSVNPLPIASDEDYLPAFVSGTLAGEVAGEAPLPFVITQDNIIVASGESWYLRGIHHFFALVEPKFINRADWAPQPWVISGNVCKSEAKP